MLRQVDDVGRQCVVGHHGYAHAAAVLHGFGGCAVGEAERGQSIGVDAGGGHLGVRGLLQGFGAAHDGIGMIDAHAAGTDQACGGGRGFALPTAAVVQFFR